jgi:hypothetical protein
VALEVLNQDEAQQVLGTGWRCAGRGHRGALGDSWLLLKSPTSAALLDRTAAPVTVDPAAGRRLGAALLDRSSRTVTLTEAGSVLLAEGRAALEAVDAAERRTRRGPRRRHPVRPG